MTPDLFASNPNSPLQRATSLTRSGSFDHDRDDIFGGVGGGGSTGGSIHSPVSPLRERSGSGVGGELGGEEEEEDDPRIIKKIRKAQQIK